MGTKRLVSEKKRSSKKFGGKEYKKHEFGHAKIQEFCQTINLKIIPPYQKSHQNLLIIPPPMLDMDLQPCQNNQENFSKL